MPVPVPASPTSPASPAEARSTPVDGVAVLGSLSPSRAVTRSSGTPRVSEAICATTV